MNRNPGIDTLRGFSILLVVLFHINLRIPLVDTDLSSVVPKRLLDILVDNGFGGVFIFFVISGFLITSNILKRSGTLAQIDVRAFYIRRAARILPFLFLLVGVLSLLHLFRVPAFTINLSKQSLGGAVLSALFFFLNWYEATTGYLPGNWDVLWSLSIEEVFYISFPIVCVLIRREWMLITAMFILALSLPLTRSMIDDNPIWMSKAYLPGMAAIAMGVLAALINARIAALGKWTTCGLRWGGGLGILAVHAIPDLLWPLIGHGLVLLRTISTAVLLIGLDQGLRLGHTKALPGLSWLRSFGRYSYEVYLTHMFVVIGLMAITSWLGSQNEYGYIWYPLTTAMAWLVGKAVAQLYTTKCNNMIRKRFLKST